MIVQYFFLFDLVGHLFAMRIYAMLMRILSFGLTKEVGHKLGSWVFGSLETASVFGLDYLFSS